MYGRCECFGKESVKTNSSSGLLGTDATDTAAQRATQVVNALYVGATGNCGN